MTTLALLQSDKYADFIDIGGTAYIFPAGFKLSENPHEKSNIVTVASGRKRYDIIKRWYSYSFEYETLTQSMMDELDTIVGAAVSDVEKKIYLKYPKEKNTTGYKTQSVDIVKPVKIKYKSRGTLTVYNGVTLEIE